jgi:hypothetical protein
MTLISLYPPYILPHSLLSRKNGHSYIPYILFAIWNCACGCLSFLFNLSYKGYKDIRGVVVAALFALYPPYSLASYTEGL